MVGSQDQRKLKWTCEEIVATIVMKFLRCSERNIMLCLYIVCTIPTTILVPMSFIR